MPVLLRVFFVVLMALAVYMGCRYYAILDGASEPAGSEEREDYDSLRQALSEGGTPAIVYNQWLTWGLEKVDKFFGDAGRKDRSWIARALYLETNGARWTAPAFDKCLLLALVYPVLTVFAIWAYSGHVGVAERALFLPADDPADHYPAVRRMASFLSALFGGYALYGSVRARVRKLYLKSYLWLASAYAGIGAFAVAGADARAGAFLFADALALAVAYAFASTFAIAGGGAFAVAFVFVFAGAVAGAVVDVFPVAVVDVDVFTVAVPFVFAGAVAVSVRWANSRGHLGHFLSLFFVAACILCLAAPYALAPLKHWDTAGALLLFLGLLTLVNAPADWLALGFTRALLRRGLLKGSWWPFLYALIDVIVAAILIAGLAFGMVLAVQTFDDIAVLRAGPGARILPLGPLFEGLESTPGDYEYWWIWFLLFSSMIPSLLNLSIAAAAFLRGLPGINRWILNRMPAGKGMRESDKLKVATALTVQVVGGAALTGAATYLVAIYLIPLGLPAFGAVVREFALALAAYNAPARAMMWLAGGH